MIFLTFVFCSILSSSLSGFIASLILSCINDNMEAFRMSGLLFFNFNLEELAKEEMLVVNSALKEDSPLIILTVTSLLRQLGTTGRNILIKTCRDKDLLRAKASISALLEMKDQTVDDLFDELLNDKSIDPMIKEDILRDKII